MYRNGGTDSKYRSISHYSADSEGKQENVVERLLSIAKATRALFGLELATIGLHQGQDELLVLLEAGKPISVSTLANDLSVRPSTVSKMLDRLHEKGLTVRVECKKDKRKTLVEITSSGISLQQEIAKLRSRMDQYLIGKMADQEATKLNLELVKIEGIVKARLARLR